MVICNSDGYNLWHPLTGVRARILAPRSNPVINWSAVKIQLCRLIDSSALAARWVWRFACKGNEVWTRLGALVSVWNLPPIFDPPPAIPPAPRPGREIRPSRHTGMLLAFEGVLRRVNPVAH